jgi:hypothetical protein
MFWNDLATDVTADEYNPTFYCFESCDSENDCSRSILTLKRLLVWLYLEEGKV